MGKVIGVFIDKIENRSDLENNTNKVLSQLKNIIVNELDIDTATKLLFWLNDWAAKYLKNEKTFKYSDLKYYERGNIVEAHFGFKVGSEQGGLHYAVVVENDNDKTNKTVVVVPLASLDDGQDPEELDKHIAFLGYDMVLCQEKVQVKREGNVKYFVSW